MQARAVAWFSMIALVGSGCDRGRGGGAGDAGGSGVTGLGRAAPLRNAAAPAAVAVPDAVATGRPGAPWPIAACSDGGAFAGALLSASEARFCVSDEPTKGQPRGSCWRIDGATGVISAVSDVGPSGLPGQLALPATLSSLTRVAVPRQGEQSSKDAGLDAGRSVDMPTDRSSASASAWRVTIHDSVVTACGPRGCAPIPLQPPVNPDDDDTVVGQAVISASGERVAVTRGADEMSRVGLDGRYPPMSVELYERATGKKLATRRTRSGTIFLQGFAGEHALYTEETPTSQGGPTAAMSLDGKTVTFLEGDYARHILRVNLADDRWAFLGEQGLALHDLAAGKRIAALAHTDEFFAVLQRRLYVFDSARVELSVYGADGRSIYKARAPTCRYEWEAEALGPLRVNLTSTQVLAALGQPRRKTQRAPEAGYVSTWTYASGVTVVVEAEPDPNDDKPVLPYRAVRISIAAPSPLRTKAGIGIGSTRAELMAAYGAHVVPAHSTGERLFVGDAAYSSSGLIFELSEDKVREISLGSAY